MTCLNDIEDVKNMLKTAKKVNIDKLHKFIFEREGDRSNRKRLREFSGFSFDEDDDLYASKSQYIDNELSTTDLTTICLMLGLECNIEDVKLYIFRNLQQGALLKDVNNDAEDEDEDDENEDEEGENHFQSFTQRRTSSSVALREENEAAASNSRLNRDQDVLQEDIITNRHAVRPRPEQFPRFALSFRDVEDSVRPFDGSDSESVEQWIEHIEENAAVHYWDDLHTLVFAKRSLQGLARLYVGGLKGLTDWPKLKNALLSEFEMKVNSRQIHKILTERTMKKDETVMEYLYKMQEVTSRGNIVDEDLIHYVIDGIRDSNQNKQILYGARNMKQFKDKIHDYQLYMAKQNNEKRDVENKPKYKPAPTGKGNHGYTSSGSNDKNMRCYNCGVVGHTSSKCRDRGKGTKCFRCNKFGHLARDCKAEMTVIKPEEVRCIRAQKENMMKRIKIANTDMSALIDTGSMANVMKSKVLTKIPSLKLTQSKTVLSGFGEVNNKVQPIGNISTDVLIDDEIYHLTFCVIPDNLMSVDVIIGTPICEEAELTINAEGVRIKKLEIKKVMQIETVMENDVPYDIGTGIKPATRKAVIELIEDYKPENLKSTNVTMKLVLSDDTPISCRRRRLPLCQHSMVEKQIAEWLKDGIIEESESEFCSPIVLAPKKDGSKRLCVDYRRINKVIVRDRFPLPILEDQLDRLQDSRIFSTIDLKNGFFHVTVDKESRKYTAFVTHNGQYEFCKVPFGLSNSPAVFQRFINNVFREMTQQGKAFPYVDDVIIPAKDEEEGIINLRMVLAVAKDFGLDLNLKKCQFMKRRIEFLGHVIENQMISPSPAKMVAVKKFPIPTTIKQVESFLGLAGYFLKFIPEFAKLAKPLSDLKKKDAKFIMGDAELASVNILKQKLAESPVLKIFNQNHETELHTDASIDGYGGILLQKSPDDNNFHPCYYMSKKTTEAERKYTSYELEIMAVVESLKKFRVYLLGKKFKLVTDCNAFAKTMEKKDLCTRVARWLLLLQEYDYIIEHRAGNQMRHVDALSRNPVMMIVEESILKRMATAQRDEPNLKPIIELLQTQDYYDNYYMKAGVLYKLMDERELVVVPGAMQFQVIKDAHEKGHFAVKKTKELLKDDYFIEKLDDKIHKVISACIKCLLVNRKKGKQEGMLRPISKDSIPLQTYHIDHLGPLESTHKGYKHIFAVIDAFTKFCWLYPVKTTSTKEAVDKLRLQSLVFGNPEIIISDRGSAFTSRDFQQYCEDEAIKDHVITTGLPRANGQVERLNSTIISVLGKLSAEDPTKWYKLVERVQQTINNTFHRSIKTSPYHLLIGKPMRTKDDNLIKEAIEEAVVNQFEEGREELRCAAKEQILEVQNENRHNYNLRRKQAASYKVGELVAIKRTQFGSGLKLKAKFLGPYKVNKVKPNDTYNVTKVGLGEGPTETTTCAEYMKKWPTSEDPFGTQG